MIILKSRGEIEKIRAACRVVAGALAGLKGIIRPGVTTLELDAFAEDYIRGRGAVPAFKGYLGYPNTLCASVNEVVIHGIPSGRALHEGEIIGLDLGAVVDGFYGDAAITVPVGEVSDELKRLVEATLRCLERGIEKARPGNRVSDISNAVQSYAESSGYSVVREFVGHGIGRRLHEEPQVPNFGPPGQGPRLKAGTTLAIEPMINMGKSGTVVLDDGWTAVTVDGKPSAHFEHTVAVTEDGPEILTLI
ncbi:MAG TPA: type I methionyl aminopeptidase [Nitrospirota bacterium]|nr:type I methionyl aminopeptidase [Nitrospirota bacterium]